MRKFILINDVQGLYGLLKKGYIDVLDYPNMEGEDGTLGICEGHGEYTWIKKEDYEILAH